MNLNSLIQRLERGSGPDRELDRAIFEAVCLDKEMEEVGAESWFCEVGHNKRYGFNLKTDNPKTVWRGCIPFFTASIDAALTTLPDGWYLVELRQLPSYWHAYIADKIDDRAAKADGKTAATAILLASLRARSAKGSENV